MTTTADYITTPTLFRHKKRTEWGIGQVMSEGPFRRRIQFEDGQTRVFKRDYYHLLEEVSDPAPESKATLDALVDDARAAMGARAARTKRRSASDVAEAVEAQVDAFRADYPLGFQDPKWKSDVRGVGAPRPLKRHRDSIAESGPALLGLESLRGHIEADGAPAVFERMLDLLRSTDLSVLKTDVKPLSGLDDAGRTEFMGSFVKLLENVDAPAHFDGLLGTARQLQVKVSWTLISSLMTLSDPANHGPVKSASLRKQAKRLGLDMSLPNQPTGHGYAAAQFILRQVNDRLATADLHPVDRIDVADFIAKTHSVD